MSKFRSYSRLFRLTLATLAFGMVAMASSATAQTVITPSDPQGWVLFSENTAGGTGAFVGGPVTPPLGVGSVRLTTPASNNGYVLGRAVYAGTKLADVTSLSYSTYRAAGDPAWAAAFFLTVDNDVTDADNTFKGRLTYEPYHTQTINTGVWQTWNTLAPGTGNWWFSNATLASLSGCTMANPCTLAEVIAAFPNVGFHNNPIHATGFKAGSGWAGFDGNVDNLTIGILGVDTTYDFEPNASVVNVGSGSLTPTANYTQWFFYNDENDSINNTLGSFVTGPASAPLGTGSAQISVTGTQRRNLATYQFAGTPLSDITVLKYSTYNPSAGNGGSANRSAFLQFNVDFDGSDTWQRRILFLPTDNGTVVQNSWQEWETINGGSALWRYSGSTWPGTATPGTTPRTWSNIIASYPGVRIRVTDSWLGMRVGEPYPDGYTENIDKFVFGSGSNVTTYNFDPLPAVVYVDDSWSAAAPGSDPDGAGPATSFGYDAFAKIQDGINGVDGGGTVNVATGTYVEDINVNKAGVTVSGAGMDSSIIIGPHTTGGPDTVLMGANNVTVQGFTITRSGNDPANWASNPQNQGVNFAQLTTGSTLQNCKLFGNRNGLYMNNTGPHTVRRNLIDNNRTGIQFANGVNGVLVEENFITNNHTLGMVMSFDSPGNVTTGFTVRNNNISGNWYGQVVNRFTNTTADLNFSGNWLGTATPTRTTANSTEPGYPAPYPVILGGTDNPPAPPAHAILGPASAKVDYSPYLNNGGDTQPGTPGFQGDFSSVSVTPDGAHVAPPTSRIQEAIDAMTGGGTLTVPAGTYPGDVNVNKAVHVKGSFTIGGTFTVSNAGAQVSPGTSPGIINSGSLALTSGSTVNIEINGPNVGSQYDQLNVTGTVSLGNATLNTTLGFTPTAGQVFTIINNDGGDAVTGTFAGLAEGDVFYEGTHALRISYVGGTGNDVTLTSVVFCSTVSISTAHTTLTGVSVNVPINVDSTTGKGLYSADFTLTYNPAVINAPVVSLGTVTAGSTLTVNHPSAGTMVISIFQATPWTGGPGTLANVSFSVPGLPGTSSPVTFSAFRFNEGTQCLTTSNGLVTVIGGTITGNVSYGNSRLPGPAVRNVPNVTITGTGPTTVSATTDANGNYSLSGFVAGSYTRTPSKLGGDNGAVTAYDSGKVARHVVGLEPFNNEPAQSTVADVSGNGDVSSFDAALIARFEVALPNHGSAGTWRFSPTSYGPSTVYTNISGENYVALLMGDVTGNWGDPTPYTNPPRPIPGGTRDTTVTAPRMTAIEGTEIEVPVSIKGTRDKDIIAYSFDLRYDANVLMPTSSPVVLNGTVSEGRVPTVNATEPGLLRVNVFGPSAIDQDGVLLTLRFHVVGNGGVSGLSWDRLMLNEGDPQVTVFAGQVRALPASDEDQPMLRGRVLTSAGQPVAGAEVLATDANGKVRAVVTRLDGTYTFRNVVPGQSYTLTVSSDRYAFAPITVSASERLTLADLIAQQ